MFTVHNLSIMTTVKPKVVSAVKQTNGKIYIQPLEKKKTSSKYILHYYLIR